MIIIVYRVTKVTQATQVGQDAQAIPQARKEQLNINICRYTIIIIKYEVLTQRLLEREKGKELPSLSHQSPLFLRQLAPHRLNTGHLEQSTATATNGFIFQVTDSSLQSVGILALM